MMGVSHSGARGRRRRHNGARCSGAAIEDNRARCSGRYKAERWSLVLWYEQEDDGAWCSGYSKTNNGYRASQWYYKEGGNTAAAASILNKTMSLVLRIQEERGVSACTTGRDGARCSGRNKKHTGTSTTTGSVDLLQEWVLESHSTKRCDLKATL
jgi:hypothetical protein